MADEMKPQTDADLSKLWWDIWTDHRIPNGNRNVIDVIVVTGCTNSCSAKNE